MPNADAINFLQLTNSEQQQTLIQLSTKLRATQVVLADRERELLNIKGPCSYSQCRLHYAHSGPCDCEPNATTATATAPGRDAGRVREGSPRD